jgi:hypothetical protein
LTESRAAPGADVREWIARRVGPPESIEVASDEPWATVLRVQLAADVVWFKACAPVQAFEAALTDRLAARWPDLLPEVLAVDEERAWLLLADAGSPFVAFGDVLDAWLDVLPRYAELQHGEAAQLTEHLAAGVPDRRLARLPALYDTLLDAELLLEPEELLRLRAYAPRFADLCDDLAGAGIPESVQHDDLHAANVWAHDGNARILDWGDSCVSHPFFTLSETFRHLEGGGMALDDPWFARLRDAYLEPWGRPAQLLDVYEKAFVAGIFEHAIGGLRQRDALDQGIARFDEWLADLLRRGLTRAGV